MSKTKGFIQIPSLHVNDPGVVAQYGELSLRSLTFSREQAYYPSSLKNVAYKSFYSKDDLGADAEVPAWALTGIHAVAELIYSLYSTNNLDTAQYPSVTELATYVGGHANVTGANVSSLSFEDEVLEDGTGPLWMPGSASFTVSDGVGGTSEVRIWFVNSLFELQYDEYEIIVIPPTTNTVDDLNTTPNNINSLITANTGTNIVLQRINNATQNARPTDQYMFDITWHDPNLTSAQYTTPWIFLGYGPAANNAANIRDAIQKYITDNTTLNLSVWQIIYPGLFELMEFYLIPYWDKVAIGPVATLYSMILNDLTVPASRGTTFSIGLSPAEVTSGLALVPALYKSIMLITVGNPNNTGGMIKLNDVYDDYVLVPTSDTDFDRMAPATKSFILALNQALSIAETATSSTPMPSGFNRITRGGHLFIGFTSGGVDYLLLTKASLEAELNP